MATTLRVGMGCDVCQRPMRLRRASMTNPYVYSLIGVRDIQLVGIDVYACPKCKGESPVIPGISALHRFIASLLIDTPGLLNGPEIRFLRKFAGASSQDMAETLGISPNRLSRVENQRGKSLTLSKAADRFLRLHALAAFGKKAAAAQELASALKRVVKERREWCRVFEPSGKAGSPWREARGSRVA